MSVLSCNIKVRRKDKGATFCLTFLFLGNYWDLWNHIKLKEVMKCFSDILLMPVFFLLSFRPH